MRLLLEGRVQDFSAESRNVIWVDGSQIFWAYMEGTTYFDVHVKENDQLIGKTVSKYGPDQIALPAEVNSLIKFWIEVVRPLSSSTSKRLFPPLSRNFTLCVLHVNFL